jgi:hypothetical protein
MGKFAGDLEALIRGNLTDAINQAMEQSGEEFETPVIDQNQLVPKTFGLEYVQGGLRFTTTLGPADFGVQYYSGYLPRPAAAVNKGGYAAAQKAIGDLNTAIEATAGKSLAFTQQKTNFEAKQTEFETAQAEFETAQAVVIAATLQAETAAAVLGTMTPGFDPTYIFAATQAGTAQAVRDAAIADATTKGGAYAAAGAAYQAAGLAYEASGTDLQTAADAASAAKSAVQAALTPEKLVSAAYNRYHHVGLDYAQVLFGFNIRAELAANITSDLAGDDGLVYNPSIAWSLGFDRDIPVVGINVNLQINESIRLLDSKVGTDSLFDIEAGTGITSTRLTASLSRSFLRNALELRATVIWGMEDKDCYIIPAVTWTKGDVAVEVSAGIFAGTKEGELGQYRDNNFIKAALSYSF